MNTIKNKGSTPVPPPRVYIVSGINSAGNVLAYDRAGNPIIADDQAAALEKRLEQYGYEPEQVEATQAIYLKPKGTDLSGTNLSGTDLRGLLSPLDWLTGGLASGVNTLTEAGAKAINTVTGEIATAPGVSTAYGAVEVLREYIRGKEGEYTEQIYNQIGADLRENPLTPRQSILLMGHSGGGAVTANLAGMLERNLGVDVSGMVTMGAPVSDYEEAGRYAETIADVRHVADPVVNKLPVIRSEEPAILADPLATLFTEKMDQNGKARPEVSRITLREPTSEPHTSYMQDPEVSVNMLRRLKKLFPNMDLQLG